MPPKSSPEPRDAKECMLQIGKFNNVVAWNLEMRSLTVMAYGSSALFVTTNERYVFPLPRESDFLVEYPVGEGDPPPLLMSAALIADCKRDAFTGRQKDIRKQKENEKKLYGFIYTHMFTASQSKVKEEFAQADIDKDPVVLWTLIRRTHLTHVHGIQEPMIHLNKRERLTRYSALRQGDREYIASFKIRYDAQVQAGIGAGLPVIDEETMAMDFLHKLDPKRFERMLNHMRRNAIMDAGESYPATLAAAVRIASAWPDEGPSSANSNPLGTDTHSAFVTADSAFVMKSKDPGGKKQSTNPTVDKLPSGKKKSLAEVECYVCAEYGHYARDCKDRKVAAKALIAKSGDKAVDEDGCEKDDEEDSVYVTTSEKVLFSKDDVLLDSQPSVNVFCNPLLLKNVRKSERQVLLNGVQSSASGVRINQEGDFKDVGRVYFSSEATANILSYAVMVDEGNAVS